MRKKIALFVLAASASQALTGCMTMLNGTTQTMPFVSYPVATSIRVVDENGVVVYEGMTPAKVTLKRSLDYKVTASAPGYRSSTTDVVSETTADNMWLCGLLNMFGGGGLGWFIDPFTGSLSTFGEDDIEVTVLRNKQAKSPPSAVSVTFEGELLPNGTATVHPSAAKP